MFKRYKLIFSYILSEMVPTFFVGLVSFVSILLLFQVLNLTDTLLQHDVSLRTLVHLLSYLSISFLPAILPMSLIFAIVLSYNRLSADSEVIAMKSLGLSMWPIMAPGVSWGVLIATISAYMSFQVGPWGNRQFEVLITDIGNSKISSSIGEGTFTVFFDLVVYANKINKNNEALEKVFIYDERNPSSPTTIISDTGRVVSEKSFNSYKAFVRLGDGEIHKTSKGGHTKIKFKNYDLQITEPTNRKIRDKSMNSLTYDDLQTLIAETKDPAKLRAYRYEFHWRIALSVACMVFVLLGIGLGCRSNNRTGKSGGGVMSVGVIVSYWILFILGNSLVKSASVPIFFAAWLPVIIMLPASLFLLRRNWN